MCTCMCACVHAQEASKTFEVGAFYLAAEIKLFFLPECWAKVSALDVAESHDTVKVVHQVRQVVSLRPVATMDNQRSVVHNL